MEWKVVGVIAVLLGIFASIMTPVIKLNKNLTELNVNLSALKEAQEDFRDRNTDEHKEFKRKDADQDKALAEHDKRITLIEHCKKS